MPTTKKYRTSLNGSWILDKKKGNPSMRKYLETMDVNELAIQAHVKGEQEHDDIHTIFLDRTKVKIVKSSRVSSDLVVKLELGKETVQMLPPGERQKKTLAVSNHPGQLQITSSLATINGKAHVTDTRTLDNSNKLYADNKNEDEKMSVMIQNLMIVNESTGKNSSTTRYFIPCQRVPQHDQEEEEEDYQY